MQTSFHWYFSLTIYLSNSFNHIFGHPRLCLGPIRPTRPTIINAFTRCPQERSLTGDERKVTESLFRNLGPDDPMSTSPHSSSEKFQIAAALLAHSPKYDRMYIYIEHWIHIQTKIPFKLFLWFFASNLCLDRAAELTTHSFVPAISNCCSYLD